MRTYKTETQTVEKVSSITCDCCGQEMTTPSGGFEGICLSVSGGPESPVIGDMCQVSVDVCERCFMRWVGTFRNPPETVNLLD